MDKIAQASVKERAALFQEASSLKRVLPAIIEKDFWVCWILQKMFADSELKGILCFKGGTSLSKVFHVIERFSEDIDIILHPNTLGVTLEEKSSKTQQDKFNKELNQKAQKYIASSLKYKINGLLAPLCTVLIDEEDPNSLLVRYPSAFTDPYLRAEVKLEIGPLASWLPNDEYPIKPYVAELIETLNIQPCLVPTIKIERTFWEKITILHALHYFPAQKSIERYSRHYYDVFQIGRSFYLPQVLKNTMLLQKVVAFKDRYYHSASAKYELAKIGSLKLLPPKENSEKLKKDYQNMQGMLFGKAPSWEEITLYLEKLEKEINSLPANQTEG